MLLSPYISLSPSSPPAVSMSVLYVCFSTAHILLGSSFVLSHVWLSATPWTVARQASLSITNSQSLSNSCPLSWQCHPTISSSVVPFSSCPQSLPASGSFQMSQFFTPGGQSISFSISASNEYSDWFPLEFTDLISLQSKGLSRVFSKTSSKASILWCSAFFILQL